MNDSATPLLGDHCGHCGGRLNEGDHASCAARLALEPPRYCAACARRMKVQVIPGEWSARCVEHGEVRASTWR